MTFFGRPRRSTRSSPPATTSRTRSEEHTSELQSPCNLVCRLLLEKTDKLVAILEFCFTKWLPFQPPSCKKWRNFGGKIWRENFSNTTHHQEALISEKGLAKVRPGAC